MFDAAADDVLEQPWSPAPPTTASLGRRLGERVALVDAWWPVGYLAALVLGCFAWPQIVSLPNPDVGNLTALNLPPLTAHHLLGTTPLGYNILSRILYGGRISIEVGVGSVLLGMAAGSFIGVAAGVAGGWVEATLMRVLDVCLSFPPLVLASLMAAYLGPSVGHVTLAIAFFCVPAFGRLSRALSLQIRESNCIVASKLYGVSWRRLVGSHILPMMAPQLVTYGLLQIGVAIMTEASLSFLGLGVPAPAPSWGNMISSGQQYLTTSPDLVIIPGMFLFVTVLAVNALGDTLRARWAVD